MAETVNTGTDDLLGELDSGVLTLTMNRPEARNAMSGEMTAAMSEQLYRCWLAEDKRDHRHRERKLRRYQYGSRELDRQLDFTPAGHLELGSFRISRDGLVHHFKNTGLQQHCLQG